MSIILVVSLLILFLLVKTYFSNSYMYALQDNLDNKNSNNLDIGQIIDNRYDQFNNNRKPIQAIKDNKINNNNNNSRTFNSNNNESNTNKSLLDKVLESASN